jgi:hypothetical protein
MAILVPVALAGHSRTKSIASVFFLISLLSFYFSSAVSIQVRWKGLAFYTGDIITNCSHFHFSTIKCNHEYLCGTRPKYKTLINEPRVKCFMTKPSIENIMAPAPLWNKPEITERKNLYRIACYN